MYTEKAAVVQCVTVATEEECDVRVCSLGGVQETAGFEVSGFEETIW